MSSIPAPICYKCKHYTKQATCKAFPDIIPSVIWTGGNPHIQEVKDDQGIRFEPKPEENPTA